jgi:hypothetical protein
VDDHIGGMGSWAGDVYTCVAGGCAFWASHVIENRQTESGTSGAGRTGQETSEKLVCRKHRVSGEGYQEKCKDCQAANPEQEEEEKPKKWKFCRLCKVQKKRDCLDCEEKNGRIMTEEEIATYFPERQPGDDTEAEEAAKMYEEAQLKKVFRSWFQEVKKIAKVYSLKWGDKINDSDPRFKRPFSLHCKARDALRDLLRELTTLPPQTIPD